MKFSLEFEKYFKNTIWLFSERAFRLGINFFVVILLTRHLGPEKYGLLSYSQSLIGIFLAFSSLGLDVILVRELAKNKKDSDVILGTAFILKLSASALSIFFVLFANMYAQDRNSAILTNIIVFSVLFQSLSLGLETYFQANVLSKLTSTSNMLVTFISSIIKICFIYFEVDLVYFACLLVFDGFLILAGYVYFYLRLHSSFLGWRFSRRTAVYLLKSGWPMLLVSMAVYLYTKVDIVMIKHLSGAESVGIYRAALNVIEIFFFIPLLVTQSVFPKLVEVKQKNEEAYFRLLERLYSYLTWIAIPIVMGIFIFSDLIVDVLYGEKYSGVSIILSVLCFTIIFNAIGAVTTKILYVENYEKKYMYRSLVGMFFNIVLNYLLISIYGAIGAAVSTIVTLFLVYYVYDLFDSDMRKFLYLKVKCFWPLKRIGFLG